MHPSLFPLLGFLVGSIPFGFLIAKSQGIDIRQHGSGNIGATNVLRVVGKKYGITCFVLDFLKGLLPAAAAYYFLDPEAPQSGTWQVATGLATILGHNYTPWLGFKGGKGIASSAGVLLALLPVELGIGLLVWVALFYTTRYVSVASIGAALAIPIALIVECLLTGEWKPAHLVFAVLVGFLATWRHRSNIKSLREGTEHKFVKK